MTGRAEITGPGTIRLERLLPGTPERVWEYLTDPELRVTWFAGGPVDLRPGGVADFRYDHTRVGDEPVPPEYHGHRERGTVTACEPPTHLAFTFGDDGPAPSHVSFTLAAVAGGTRLVLEHSRLDLPRDFTDAAAGWHAHLDVLGARLDGQVPPPFFATHDRLGREYAAR